MRTIAISSIEREVRALNDALATQGANVRIGIVEDLTRNCITSGLLTSTGLTSELRIVEAFVNPVLVP